MAVASAVSMGMGSLNFGLYIKPMGEQLSIGRASFGWASTFRSISGASTSPIIGNLLDRYGARWILAGSTIITGSCMVTCLYPRSMATHGFVFNNGPSRYEWARCSYYLGTTI